MAFHNTCDSTTQQMYVASIGRGLSVGMCERIHVLHSSGANMLEASLLITGSAQHHV